MRYKLGKQPATHDPRDLQYAHYRTIVQPKRRGCFKPKPTPGPPTPSQSDTDNMARVQSWGMMANDSVGDCVFAAAAHETMLWTAIGSTTATFSDKAVLSDYSAVTGYNPKDPNTDQGTNVHDALDYRKHTGVVDAAGQRHLIGAYMALEVANVEHAKEAIVWFDNVEIGFNCPQSALDQFDNGQPWTVVPSQSAGGHDVCMIGFDSQWLYVVTWGRVQKMSWQFYTTYSDEAWALLSDEYLRDGKSPEGFDLAQLQADLQAVK